MSYGYALRILFATLAYGAAFLISPSPCGAQESSAIPKVGESVKQYFKVPTRDGEFRRAFSPGFEGISCTLAVKPGEPPPTGPNYSHCLRLGPLKLGEQFYMQQIALMNLKTIPEQNITNPRLVNRTPDGILTVVIPITTIQSGDDVRMQSYLVALLDSSGAVQSYQLTGKPSDTSSALPFSSIALGMPKDEVADILGFPSSVSDVPAVQGKLWSYAPFPFSIEFVNGVVYSVRIHNPSVDELRMAFRPLRVLPE